MSKSILITGGTGFIGSNIVRYFLENSDYYIVVIDRTLKSHNMFSGSRLEYLQFDLKDISTKIDGLAKYNFEYIFHQGAIVDTRYDNDDIYEINTNAINHLIDLAERCNSKLIYASSCATYGNSGVPNRVGFDEEPLNKYGKSKLLQDQIVHNYLANPNHKVQIVGLRYSNVYGWGEGHKGVMASMIFQIYNKMINGETVRLFEFGEQKRDFVSVDDIVAYNVAAANSDKEGIFNAGFGFSYSFNDMIRFFELYYNRSIPIEFIKNPYPFYQNHTLAQLDRTLYNPLWDLKHGIFRYLDLLNKKK